MRAEKTEKCMVDALFPESQPRNLFGDSRKYVTVESGEIWGRFLHFGM
jgi:hypothetical protein